MNLYFDDLVTELLIHMAAERGLSYNYLRLTERTLHKFSTWLAETHPAKLPNAVTTDEVIDYMRMERDRGISSSSVKTVVAALKLFFGFLKNRNISEHDPTAVMRFPKVDWRVPSVLNEQETAQLLAVDFTTRPSHARDRTLPLRDRSILELLYASGIRNGELIMARLQDLDLPARTLRVTGKGQKERLVLFGRPARAALENYLECERRARQAVSGSPADKDMLFLSFYGKRLTTVRIWQLLKEIAALTGIAKPVYPHLLRHSFATHLLAHGANLRVIQELLGHADISTTARYTHLDLTQLQAVYRQCHPRALSKDLQN